ncbi:hypothetical protein [Leifsonia xyli]|uniref:hypothetical protein n=1 Tax=Leifsonia xyli TaxID=1575 RepID=UPI003D67F7ED
MTDHNATAPFTAPLPTSSPSQAPIRWGGVVWGILLALFAAVTLWVVSSAERADQAGRWLTSLTPGSAWALAAAVVGLVIVVSALLGGIRASQRRRLRTRD